MTVQKVFVKNRYDGNGSKKNWPITFDWDKNHQECIKVYTRVNGVLSQTTNFTIQISEDTGNYEVFYPAAGEALASGDKIIIAREIPLQQVLNLVNQGPFFADDIELTFDEVVMMCQQLNERLGRSLKVGIDIDSDSDIDVTIPVPTDEKNYGLRMTKDGFQLVNDPSEVYDDTVAIKNQAESAKLSAQNAASVAQAKATEATTQAGLSKDEADRAKAISDALPSNWQDIVKKTDGYVTPEMYGAVGDGVTDDTDAFKAALATKKNVLISKEGKYIISDTLKVDVSCQWFRGISAKCILVTKCSADVETVLFHSNASEDYQTRENRSRKHGNFSVRGYDIWNASANGIKVGGASGTIYKGAIDQQLFENIVLTGVNKALVTDAHFYKNTFINICMNNHNNYSWYCASNADCGECITFENCAFWGCSVYATVGDVSFISCTFHPGHEQTVGSRNCCHYFGGGVYRFFGCHIEVIVYSQAQADAIHNTPFLFVGSQATWYDLDGCITNSGGDYITVANGVMKAINGSLPACVRIVGSSNLKYLLTRIKSNDALFIGNIQCESSYYFNYDNANIPQLYSYSTYLTRLDDVVKLITSSSESSDTYSMEKGEDGKSVDITIDFVGYRDAGLVYFSKKYDVSNKKSVRVEITPTLISGSVQLQAAPDGSASLMYFTDENGDVVADNYDNCNTHLYKVLSSGYKYVHCMGIPPKAKYMHIGLNTYTGARSTSTVKVNIKAMVEFF